MENKTKCGIAFRLRSNMPIEEFHFALKAAEVALYHHKQSKELESGKEYHMGQIEIRADEDSIKLCCMIEKTEKDFDKTTMPIFSPLKGYEIEGYEIDGGKD